LILLRKSTNKNYHVVISLYLFRNKNN